MHDSARALAGEFHAGVLKLAAAALLGVAGRQASPNALLRSAFFVAAALSATAAVLPWLWPRARLAVMRGTVWGACAVTIAAGTAGLLVANVGAWLAAQLLLVAAVMGELGPRRHVLRWFWLATVPIVVTVVAYYAVAPVRPMPD